MWNRKCNSSLCDFVFNFIWIFEQSEWQWMNTLWTFLLFFLCFRFLLCFQLWIYIELNMNISSFSNATKKHFPPVSILCALYSNIVCEMNVFSLHMAAQHAVSFIFHFGVEVANNWIHPRVRLYQFQTIQIFNFFLVFRLNSISNDTHNAPFN